MTTKFCVDCKHHDAGLCNAPGNKVIHPVSGNEYRMWRCFDNRNIGFLSAYYRGACGEQARWFEPKDETK